MGKAKAQGKMTAHIPLDRIKYVVILSPREAGKFLSRQLCSPEEKNRFGESGGKLAI
jgi:hypothetical protein